jgi:diguanylate cyclase (GGDEF)-like protein
MENKPVNILLIEDNPGDARLIKEFVSEIKDSIFTLNHADCISAGLELLAKEKFDVVLLDLFLPDRHGFATFESVHSAAPEIPVIVLTGYNDEALAIKTIHNGAQDYLIKDGLTAGLIHSAIHYALERQRMKDTIRSLAIEDKLTGLFNQRGFMLLAQFELKLAKRLGREILLFFIDVDNFRKVNETMGRRGGDRVLVETGAILKKTFRESDVIARIGGDEFVILAIKHTPTSADVMASRFKKNIADSNSKNKPQIPLSVSFGTVSYNMESTLSVEELLSQAADSMRTWREGTSGAR